MPANLLHIAIASPIADGFDYLAGPDIPADLPPGCRIRVPFGNRNVVGLFIKNLASSEIPAAKLKNTCELIDTVPVLGPDLLKLAQWAGRYYQYPLGEVIQSMLPLALRQGKAAQPKATLRWLACADDQQIDLLHRAPRQQQLLKAIAEQKEGITEDQLHQSFRNWRPAMRELEKKALVRVIEELHAAVLQENTPEKQEPPVLTGEQQNIVNHVTGNAERFNICLIEGVTGSGKTEVYLRLVQHALQRRKQCLVLVPEIGLTPQLLNRFTSRLDATVVTWHSGLSDRQRHQIWYAAGSGRADVIIGTRSAVFLPLARPGLIVIDEEHDTSFKQQDSFRYHARDLAIVRAQQLAIPIVLGSATPSLESLHNAQQQRYQLQYLRQRAGGAQLPAVGLLDIHNSKVNEAVSNAMLGKMADHLQQGSQVLLFLNRRGFAPVLLCDNCDWKSDCPRCDAHMTLHHSDHRLRCHHCGHEQIRPERCPACNATGLQPIGTGTEKLEHVLQTHFPEHSILRIDRDAVRRKGALERRLARAQAGEANILLGTQMLAKGHHFPAVTLVGVLGIDQALFSADFRGPEYMAQLIVQVAGRAGRGERRGEVWIETRQPRHPLLQLLISQGYPAFADAALRERQEAGLPPFSYLALIRAEAVTATTALDFLSQLATELKRTGSGETQLLGPLPAPMERRAGRVRAQLLLQSTYRPALHHCLRRLREIAGGLPQRRKIRWSIDVDPVEML